MNALRLTRFLASAVLTASVAMVNAPVPAMSADPCPDVEAVFARGTGEPPGVGGQGADFAASHL